MVERKLTDSKPDYSSREDVWRNTVDAACRVSCQVQKCPCCLVMSDNTPPLGGLHPVRYIERMKHDQSPSIIALHSTVAMVHFPPCCLLLLGSCLSITELLGAQRIWRSGEDDGTVEGVLSPFGRSALAGPIDKSSDNAFASVGTYDPSRIIRRTLLKPPLPVLMTATAYRPTVRAIIAIPGTFVHSCTSSRGRCHLLASHWRNHRNFGLRAIYYFSVKCTVPQLMELPPLLAEHGFRSVSNRVSFLVPRPTIPPYHHTTLVH